MAVLEEFVPNEGDGWHYVVDALTHGLEEALADTAGRGASGPTTAASSSSRPQPSSSPVHLLVGPHLEWASLLGRRTAELHLALTSDDRDPDFAPEPLTALDRQALYHGARSLTRQVLRDVGVAGRRLAPSSRRCWSARTRSSSACAR